MNKTYVDLTSEGKNNDYVSVKYGISSGKTFEELLKSKSIETFFVVPKDRTVPTGDIFEGQYKGKGGLKI